MLDRESTFKNPEVVKLLKENFIPIAIDQAYQRRQKDNEGSFYQKIANQGPRKVGKGTTQGLYIADASGKLLGFSNNRGAERVINMMRKAMKEPRTTDFGKITKGKSDLRYNPSPPKGGLVIRVTTKVLGGYEKTENTYRKIMHNSLGRDNFWVTGSEKKELINGKLPDTFLRRLVRFHLVDNTRGEPTMWGPSDIRTIKGNLENGQLSAKVVLRNGQGDRGYEAQILGIIKTEAGEITGFDAVAKGQYWGEGKYTRNAPEGRFPLAVAFKLADGKDIADTIPPQGSRGWVRGYIN